MNRYILFLVLMTGLLLAMPPKVSFCEVLANDQNSDVSITITQFQVNDQTLELSWKIKNCSDHDVWILDKFHLFEPMFEVFLATDNHTLIIRRRLDVPEFGVWFFAPEGRYVRLQPGEERLESLSLDIPISISWLFAGGEWSALDSATIKRIQLEIGYYGEDLPQLIRSILSEAEKHSLIVSDDSHGVVADYFPGLLVYFFFGGLSLFDTSYEDGSGEIWVPYTYKALKGEQVLLATVHGVSIPYRDEPQSETETAGVTMALTGFDVNDTNLELAWKIINASDHEVWFCDSVSVYGVRGFDSYIAKDAKTLVIRRRSDLLVKGIVEFPIKSRYIRLRPDQERFFSLSLPLRFITQSLLEAEVADNPHAFRQAECIALEIGFYDEDLRELILKVVELAEKLNCDTTIDLDDNDIQVLYPYFGGLWIESTFNRNTEIRKTLNETGDEFILPLIGHILKAEKTLRITVDGVSIPAR